MSQTFAIRMPKESTTDIGAFVPWIMSHICPALPVNKTKTNPQALSEVFKLLQQELTRFTDYERLKLRHDARNASDKATSYTKEDHSKWVSMQTLELHLTSIMPGVYNVSAILFGPEYLPSVQELSAAEVNIGQETINRFYIQAYYEESHDNYWVKFIPFGTADIPFMPEGMVALVAEPEFDISIEQKETRKPLTELFDLYHQELQKSAEKHANRLGVKMFSEFSEMMKYFSNSRLFTDNLAESSKALSGGLYDPIRFSAYGFSLPCKNGIQLFSVVGFNTGRQYTIPMPILFIGKKES